MPFVTVETNLDESQLSEDFGPSLSKFAAETLNKPEAVIFTKPSPFNVRL